MLSRVGYHLQRLIVASCAIMICYRSIIYRNCLLFITLQRWSKEDIFFRWFIWSDLLFCKCLNWPILSSEKWANRFSLLISNWTHWYSPRFRCIYWYDWWSTESLDRRMTKEIKVISNTRRIFGKCLFVTRLQDSQRAQCLISLLSK